MATIPRCSVYNGTVLPNKPEFDATKYPNWLILNGTNSATGAKQYIWLACSKPFLKYAEGVYVYPADSEIIGFGANKSTCTWSLGTITKEEGPADYYTFSGTYVWSYQPIYSYSDPAVMAHPAGDMVTDWDAEEPTITALTGAGTADSPTGYWKGDAATALTCTATVGDGGTLSYKWYRNGTYVGSGSSYTPSTATAGSFLYQCTVTNTRTAASGFSDVDTIQSDILAIVVTAKEDPDTPDTPDTPDSPDTPVVPDVKASKHKHIIGYVLKQCGVPMAEMIAEMICKVKKTASLYLYGTPSETGNIGLRVGESVTLYDGAVLPPLPNTDLLYKYVCKKGGSYFFVAKKSKQNTSLGVIVTAGLAEDGDVLLWAFEDGSWIAQNDVKSGSYTAVWCNEDITSTEGTLIEATEPVPVSGLIGYHHGLSDLPIFPAWDMSARPYALMYEINSNYHLLYCKEVSFEMSGANAVVICNDITWNWYNANTPALTGGVWEQSNKETESLFVSAVDWANFDVINAEDSSVALTASELVPVYE